MKREISLILGALIFGAFMVGCSDKNAVHEPIKNEFMAYTQKFESVKENDRYLVVGTYLNPVYPDIRNEKEDEIFILSVYPKENMFDEKTLKINGSSSGVKVELLSENDPLMRLRVFNLPWSNHYKITSANKNSRYLEISYKSANNLDVNLKFQKLSKSLYWAPKIKLKD